MAPTAKPGVLAVLATVPLWLAPGARADEAPHVDVHAMAIGDFASVHDDGSFDLSGFERRTAWVGIAGTLGRGLGFKTQADISTGSIRIKDLYIEWQKDGVRLRLGQQKLPSSVEWATSTRYVALMEKSSIRDAFDFGRQYGLTATRTGQSWGLTAGAFRRSADEDGTAPRWSYVLRASAGQPLASGAWIAAASVRYRDNGGAALTYSARPANHLADRLIDYTGSDADITVTGSLAFQSGAFFGAAEATGAWPKGDAGPTHGTTRAGYLELGWTITGESRLLDPHEGRFRKQVVASPITGGGMGLWQMAVRLDAFETPDMGAESGSQRAVVVGLTWSPEDHTRVMVNMSHAHVNLTQSPASDVDGIALRLQAYF